MTMSIKIKRIKSLPLMYYNIVVDIFKEFEGEARSFTLSVC